jgi:hypothetical protein
MKLLNPAFRVIDCHKKRYYHADSHAIAYNGTAVAGVNVTGAAIRLTAPIESKERVPVASQYGAVFAITVREGC